jgi:hypothetical protein
MTENIATFLQSLRTSRSVLKASNGSDLIGAQPWRGSLAYLHILHPPIGGDEIEALEQLYGRPFPEDIKSLYRLTNGLSLFDKSEYLRPRRELHAQPRRMEPVLAGD